MSNKMIMSITGLGYVGLPAAVAFAKNYEIIAFDFDKERIKELRAGCDRTLEVSHDELILVSSNISYVDEPSELCRATIHFIIVPTPVNNANEPDLRLLVSATKTVGKHIKEGDIVIYESSVFPGATEEECIPLLEAESGLKFNDQFSVGYSPERINPGDKVHGFKNTIKIVSASNAAALEAVYNIYSSVIDAKIHRAPTIKVAELAKIIENTQRDINIALMNELSHICHRLNIDTGDVLEAAGTKWNFLHFTPGLVGGHCIGVDPYYLTHRAERAGYHPEVILAGRRINDGMGFYIAQAVVRHCMKNNIYQPSAIILGITFKENVPDIRNTRVVEIYSELKSYGVDVQIADAFAFPDNVKGEFGIDLTPFEALKPASAVILAVSHDCYVEGGWSMIKSLLVGSSKFVADVKHTLERAHKPEDITLWRL